MNTPNIKHLLYIGGTDDEGYIKSKIYCTGKSPELIGKREIKDISKYTLYLEETTCNECKGKWHESKKDLGKISQ